MAVLGGLAFFLCARYPFKQPLPAAGALIIIQGVNVVRQGRLQPARVRARRPAREKRNSNSCEDFRSQNDASQGHKKWFRVHSSLGSGVTLAAPCEEIRRVPRGDVLVLIVVQAGLSSDSVLAQD